MLLKSKPSVHQTIQFRRWNDKSQNEKTCLQYVHPKKAVCLNYIRTPIGQ